MENQLEQLKKHTIVVADTGDFESMRAYSPQDATTNPSLILKAVQQEAYRPILEQVVNDLSKGPLAGDALVEAICDRILIEFGKRILEIVPGRVSTEVDARLSFDTEATVKKAKHLIQMYHQHGVATEQVLIKIASTWEGIRAADQLESDGIHCNLTLMFSLEQAIACAEAGVTLISPFVGRIYDWYMRAEGRNYVGLDDPGVQSVHQIFNYYKKFGYDTEVMGASFRNKGQILSLCGCDLLTIAPDLLAELKNSDEPVERALDASKAGEMDIEKVEFNEASFRLRFNNNPMATEKTAEGIRKFAEDIERLEDLVRDLLNP